MRHTAIALCVPLLSRLTHVFPLLSAFCSLPFSALCVPLLSRLRHCLYLRPSRLLQGDPSDWDYNSWAAEQFTALGLGECVTVRGSNMDNPPARLGPHHLGLCVYSGDHCVALLAEFEDREHDLLNCALMEVLEAVVLCGVPTV